MVYPVILDSVPGIGDGIGETIQKNLIPSWLDLVVQLSSFIVLLIVVICLAYKPVKKMLKARADYIEQQIKDAEQQKAVAEKNATQSQETILASKAEAASIIKEANRQANLNKEAILEETRIEVARLKANAEEDIAKSKEEALEAIRDEMVSVALSASSEILKREVNEEDNARLAEEFIEKL